jgi:hypothetical protein
VQRRLDGVQGRVAATWDSLGEKEEGSVGARLHTAGQRVMNDLTAEERLTRNIPKDVTKV